MGRSRLSLPLVHKNGTVGREWSEGKPLNRPKPSVAASRPCACLSPAMLSQIEPLIFPLIARSKFYDWAAPPPQKFDVPSTITRLSFITHNGCIVVFVAPQELPTVLHRAVTVVSNL